MAPDMLEAGWNCSRSFSLASPTEGAQCHWCANVTVYAREVSVISRFRLDNLTIGNILEARPGLTREDCSTISKQPHQIISSVFSTTIDRCWAGGPGLLGIEGS